MAKIYAENYVTFTPNTEKAKQHFHYFVRNVIDGCKQQHPRAIQQMKQAIHLYKEEHGHSDKVIGFIANVTDECMLVAHFNYKNAKEELFDLHYDEVEDRHYIIA